MIDLECTTAISQHPCLGALASLVEEGPGWLFLPPLVIDGVECLFGVCERQAVTETITVRSPDDVTVVRLRTEDFLAATGRLGGVLWEFSGPLVEAVALLTGLPPDEHPSAPRLLRPPSSMYQALGHS